MALKCDEPGHVQRGMGACRGGRGGQPAAVAQPRFHCDGARSLPWQRPGGALIEALRTSRCAWCHVGAWCKRARADRWRPTA